jgi:hypothetical protein
MSHHIEVLRVQADLRPGVSPPGLAAGMLATIW